MLNYTPRRRARTDRTVTTYTIICAWCNERQRHGNSWGPRTTRGDERNLSHGICPECFNRERAKIDGKPDPLQAPRS
jgi:hypothetical protein